MLRKSKSKKANRIAISEIMISIFLLISLGITTAVLLLKLSLSRIFFKNEERVEVMWVANCIGVMTYSLLNIMVGYILYTGIKEKCYWKCILWLYTQITALCVFTLAVMKQMNDTVREIHYFELTALTMCIYAYKLHHITRLYGILSEFKETYKLHHKEKAPRLVRKEVQVSRVTSL